MDTGYWFMTSIWIIVIVFTLANYLSIKFTKKVSDRREVILTVLFYIIGFVLLAVLGSIIGFSFFSIKLTLYYMPFFINGYLYGH